MDVSVLSFDVWRLVGRLDLELSRLRAAVMLSSIARFAVDRFPSSF